MTTSSAQRIRDAAGSVDVTLDDVDIVGGSRLLDRLSGALRGALRESQTPRPAVPHSHDGSGSSAKAAPPPDPPALAGAGGAYITVLDDATTPTPRTDAALSGWTFAVKDLIAVRGLPIGAGSRVRTDAPPEASDAPVVASLRSAGAQLRGTTTLHEFAFGVTGINHHTGTPVNPAAPGRIPGGSSSGSAVAVAERSVRLAVGTDTGGSVRIPAALCGVVGFKPTFGRYPTAGVFPLSPSLDHVGLMAATVDDVDAADRLLSGRGSGRAEATRFGVLTKDLQAAAPVVRDAVEQVIRLLRSAGFELIDVALPAAERVFAVSTAIMFAEAAAVHRETLGAAAGGYGPDVRMRLIQGLAIAEDDLEMARSHQSDLQTHVRDIFGDVDCIIGPTVPIVAPSLDGASDAAVSAALVSFTRVANVTGIPALSVPVPRQSFPVGVHVMGMRDETVLAAGALVEELLAS